MAPIVIRPENILRRAEELIAVGKTDSALQTLHEFLTSKKTRSVPPSALEPIALLFVQLSVDAKKDFTLKDGLHQFRKNIQVTEAGSPVLETVTRKLIELADKKLESVQQKVGITEDDDLDITESPESILLSAVSNEQSKDRADRELVAPWIRFLWESYRLVLELLRNNARLEITYTEVFQQASQFCLKYQRKFEFKKLSDLLRVHLVNSTNQTRTSGSRLTNAIDLQDPETLQRSLDLRFNQLNVSVKLELWQEAFRIVEDIHSVISVSKRSPKPNMMVSYYENLAKIFLVSENALFHSAAWHRFFSLYSQSPNATEEQLTRYSSIFLLSSLAIPHESFNLDFSEDFSKNSKQRLAALLNLPRVPTREFLIKYALTKNVYDFVDPSVKKLYELLEADFHPLSIRQELTNVIQELQSNPHYAPYTKALLKAVLTRLFERVSQVYESVKLDFLVQLATFTGAFELSPLEIEGFLLNAGRDGQLSFHIDHDAGVVTFHNNPFEESSPNAVDSLQASPADLVRSQLSNLAKTLYSSVKYTDSSYAEKQRLLRERLIAATTEALAKEYEELELSRALLEERKQKEELEKKQRELDLAKEKQRKLEEEKAAEIKRVEEETKRREQERIQRESDALKRRENKKLVEEINAKGIIKLDIDNLDDLDKDKILLMQVEQLEKEKNDVETRVKALFKRLDHTERAYRKFELPLLEKDASLQTEKDLKVYEEFKAKRVAAAKKEHEEDLALKKRLQKFIPEFESFSDKVRSEVSVKRDALIKENTAKLEAAKQERIEQVRQERYKQKVAEYEEELKRQAEEEQRKKAEEEAAKRREEREAAQAHLDSIAAKQREAEALAEAKLRSQRGSGGYRPPSLRNSSSSSPAPAPAPSSSSSSSPAPASDAPMTYAQRMKLKRAGRI